MCSLFGIIDYGHVLTTKQKNKILTVLSRESEIRGTDATGIAYNRNGTIKVFKRPLPARKMHFRVPDDVHVVMGHTRMATQGKASRNQNNHPWSAGNFALAHNGVLWNDRLLRTDEHLPKTNIETDSYVAVQLLAKEKALNFDAIKKMAEKVRGSFVFTILDKDDNLYFVRGDNPLAIFCYGGFILYASTADILKKTEKRLRLRHTSEIETEEGDILMINKNGERSWGFFIPQHSYMHWWRPRYGQFCFEEIEPEADLLFDVARSMGISPDEIQALRDCGCEYEEIEELIYDPQLLHEIAAELVGAYY